MKKETIKLELSREQFANLIGKLELLAELTTQPETAAQTKRLQTDLLAMAYPLVYKKKKARMAGLSEMGSNDDLTNQ